MARIVSRLLIGLMFVFMIVPVLHAASEFNIVDDIKCTTMGDIKFGVSNSFPVDISADDIQISASGPGSSNRVVNGVWELNGDEVEEIEAQSKRRKFVYYFESEKGVFRLPGVYQISIVPKGLGVSVSRDVVCPGFDRSCRNMKTEITSCKNENGHFSMDFTIKDRDETVVVDPYQDLFYEFEGPDKIWSQTLMPRGGSASFASDKYTMRFPTGSSVAELGKISVRFCNSMHYPRTVGIRGNCKVIEPKPVVEEVVEEIEESLPAEQLPPQVEEEELPVSQVDPVTTHADCTEVEKECTQQLHNFKDIYRAREKSLIVNTIIFSVLGVLVFEGIVWGILKFARRKYRRKKK